MDLAYIAVPLLIFHFGGPLLKSCPVPGLGTVTSLSGCATAMEIGGDWGG